ncbi:MAG: hypothetical protein V5A23_08730 [Halobacteriales archaeon]
MTGFQLRLAALLGLLALVPLGVYLLEVAIAAYVPVLAMACVGLVVASLWIMFGTAESATGVAH